MGSGTRGLERGAIQCGFRYAYTRAGERGSCCTFILCTSLAWHHTGLRGPCHEYWMRPVSKSHKRIDQPRRYQELVVGKVLRVLLMCIALVKGKRRLNGVLRSAYKDNHLQIIVFFIQQHSNIFWTNLPIDPLCFSAKQVFLLHCSQLRLLLQ